MKTFIVFILWVVLGSLLGGKMTYEYVVSQFSDNVDTIVGQIIDQGMISGAQHAASDLQNKWEEFLTSQKDKAKEQLKQSLTQAINQQIDAFLQ